MCKNKHQGLKLYMKDVVVTPEEYLEDVTATHTSEVHVVDSIQQNQKLEKIWSFRK